MTGGELAAAAMAGKVVAHAGKEIAEESKSIKKELLDRAKETPEFSHAATEYAKRIAIRQEILTSFYKPIAKLFGVASHYFENDFEREMAEKLADVPEENLVAPKASLAAPAMQQLAFSLDEPNLKEMYLNLLATASDNRKQGSAHPSFVEVIKQLSAEETPILNMIIRNPSTNSPIVRIKLVTKDDSAYNLLKKHVINMTDPSGSPVAEPNIATYIDNWNRLGLVDISYANYLSDNGAYEWVPSRPELVKLQEFFASNENKSVDFDKGYINPTDFGLAFARAVGIMP